MLRAPVIFIAFLLSISLLVNTDGHAQESKSINWLTFEQLEDSLAVKPKKVFIDFYTDWCTYCRKMDKVVFSKPDVIDLLDEQYYAVRFDAETEEKVNFGGQVFGNEQVGKSRRPVHQLAQLLALRNNQFAPPVLVVLDQDFRVISRYFQYLDSKKLIKALTE
ncbi:MAG: thioredoxin fold domain-containing protein [Bacteroidota bacterium]